MPRSRFLSAVLRPFSGESEVEIAARRSIEGMLDETNPDVSLLDEAAARFDAADARPRKLGRILRCALLVGALAMVLWPPAIKTEWEMGYAARIAARLFYNPFEPPPAPLTVEERERCVDFLFPNATPEQKLLLSSGSTASAEALWRDYYPDDPTIYYHFARLHLKNADTLPPDFLSTAERLDPDNGYPALLMAGKRARKSVKKELSIIRNFDRSLPSIQRPLKTYTVQNEKAFRESLDLFAQAANRAKFESRRPDILRRCTENLPPPGEDMAASCRFARAGWLFFDLVTCGEILYFRYVDDVISARAAQLEASGDKEGLAALARQWLDFMPRAVGGESFLVDSLILSVCIQSSGRQLLKSCRVLGLDDEARQLEMPVVAACELNDATRKITDEKEQQVLLRAGSMGTQLLPCYMNLTGDSLRIDPKDLTADRLGDYTLLEWLAAHGGVFILMAAAGVAALGWFRWGGLGSIMGKRFASSMTPADWVWILVLGVLVPLAWHGLVTRIPAFQARDIFWRVPVVDGLSVSELPWSAIIVLSIFFSNSISLLQCLATLIFLLAATVQSARWRVAVRGRVLGFRWGRLSAWLGWSGPLVAALALPACGIPAIVFDSGGSPESRHLLPAAILLGYAVLWLLVVMVRAALGRPAHGLERATLARVLVPGFLCAAIAVGIAGRFAAAEHRHWMALDPFGVVSPQYNGVTKYEYLTTRWLQERLLKSFGEETAR